MVLTDDHYVILGGPCILRKCLTHKNVKIYVQGIENSPEIKIKIVTENVQ